VQQESDKNVLFETKTPMGSVLRQSYIAK